MVSEFLKTDSGGNSGESRIWVPKVQGFKTESLWQKDRVYIFFICIRDIHELLFLKATFFNFIFGGILKCRKQF